MIDVVRAARAALFGWRVPKAPVMFLLGLLALVSLGGGAASAPVDKAARGLDMYVEMPASVVAGGKLMIDVRTFGFASAVEPAPLGGVHLEAAFKGREDAAITAESTDDGTATLTMTLPDDKAESATVVLAMTYGEHRRVRSFSVNRKPRYAVQLQLQETAVAPGSRIPVWLFARDAESGEPARDVEVLVSLTEGGVARSTAPLRTDASGSATTEVDIPEVDEPTFGWRLTASTTKVRAQDSSADLSPREDAPAQPTVTVTFDAVRWPAGSPVGARARVTAATGEPMVKQPIDYVFSDDGGGEPSFDRWEKEAKHGMTDDTGALVLSYPVPAVAVSTTKKLSVRTEIEGREYDAETKLEVVAKASPTVELEPEAEALVPGVEQRVLVRAKDGFDKPIASADLRVEGDGLTENVTTDARGTAEIRWKVPKDVGASRKVGPCANSVATTVRVAAVAHAPKELISAGPVPKCIAVDREAHGVVRPKTLVVRSGESLGFEVAYGEGKEPVGPLSASMGLSRGEGASMAWFKGRSGDLKVPTSSGGVFEVNVAVATSSAARADAHAAVLVKPRILPKLTSKITGGRLAPGGEAVVEARLVDETGAPLQGAVMGVVFDKLARPDEGIPPELDTRLGLCHEVSIEAADCDAMLAGDAAMMPLLRGSLPHPVWTAVHVGWDPGGSAKEEMRKTFNAVLKNLEGAVMESSVSDESLRDVLRKGPKGNDFNPEILTLVTAVLSEPPTTPGGEPFTLEDLRALDPQVTYDNVAKRVTRLKMFRVLSAMRAFRNQQDLDANEPVFRDPNGILRRLMVRDRADDGDENGGLDQSVLLDPWGTPMEFVKAGSAATPFINVVPGWELHAAGPDHKIGTADDIKDPFARVVKSGTPYARAMSEDKIVDSRLDMRVGEETVSKWSSLFEEFTGSQLSTGEGFGSGHGRLGGSHRTKAPSVRMGATSVTRDRSAYITGAPVRTDKDGVAILKLPLGADETTYRILLVAMPDGAGHAASAVDVAASLPLSVRVLAGSHWTQGDTPEARIKLTNRTAQAIRGKLTLGAGGAAALAKGEQAERTVDLPAKSVVELPLKLAARSEGEARITAAFEGGGQKDAIEHRVGVGPAGRRMTLARSRWVDRQVVVDTFASDAITTLDGAPSLEIEASFDETLASAMNALRADKLSSIDAATDALETFERMRIAFQKTDLPLAAKADRMRELATGRFLALSGHSGNDALDLAVARRARFWMKHDGTDVRADAFPKVEACPAEKSTGLRLREAEGEPTSSGGGVESCWDAAVSDAMHVAKSNGDPVALARLILAFSERSHRQSLALELAPELAKEVKLGVSGEIVLDRGFAGDRSAKAIVYAALIRASALGYRPATPADTLLGWLLVQRAPDGGFGSALATRAAVAALIELGPRNAGKQITVTELDAGGDAIGAARRIEVGRGTRVALDARTRRVVLDPGAHLDPKGKPAVQGVLVRVEQRALRAYSMQPGSRDLANPLSMEVKWPGDASVAHPSSLEIRFDYKGEATTRFIARIPLPPGATLAQQVEGVRLINGSLLVTSSERSGGPSVPMIVPIRFSMGGTFTVPESTVRAADDDAIRARGMASRVKVVGLPSPR